ncbi:MAG: autotransporter-associated beta strand repeat-containing protein [Rhizobium sp.]|nr:autotransporter-associated beta strand repeat-containing protein [Rhizobium sp.]
MATGGTATQSGAIGEDSPGRPLEKIGAGTLLLTGTNTYTGTTTISGGTLGVSGNSIPDLGAVILSNASGVQLIVSGTETIGSLSGGGPIGGNVVIENQGSIPGRLITGGDNSATTFSGTISGAGGLTKIGSGIFTLSGTTGMTSLGFQARLSSNSYTGETRVEAGTLKLDANGALPSQSGIVVLNGATLDLGTSQQTTRSIGGVAAGGILTGAASSGLTLIADADQSIAGASFTGSGILTKQGTGTLTIAGDMTYSGFIFIEAGKIALTGNNTLTRTIQGSGTLGLGSSGAAGGATGSISGNGLTIEYADGITIASSISSASSVNNVKLKVANGTATQSGFMSGGLEKIGAGTLVLTGSVGGQTAMTIREGALNVRGAASLGPAAGATQVLSGAALQIQGGFSTNVAPLTLNGQGIANDGALRNISGFNSYNGAISLGSATRINSDSGRLDIVDIISGTNTNLTFGGAGDISVNNAIRIGTGSLTKDGAGTLLLNGVNTYTGTTSINGGQMYATSGNAISDTGAVVLADAAGVIFGVSSAETIGSLSGGGMTGGHVFLDTRLTTGGNNTSTTYAGRITGVSGLTKVGTGTLTLSRVTEYSGDTIISGGVLQLGDGGTTGGLNSSTNVINNATITFNRSDDFTISNIISGTGGLTKQGAGILTLTGANTYTGATRIEGGTLKLGAGGSLSSASLITVSAGATFDFGSLANPTIGSLGGTGGSLTGGSGNLTIQMASDSTETYSGTNPFGGFSSLIIGGNGTLNLTGDINSTKNIAINGGTLSLSGNNTLTGGITVNGKLVLGSSGAAGGTGNRITTTGSVIDYANTVNNATPITINSNTTQFQVLTGSATQSGAIDELGGARPFEKIGAGTLTLSATNTYTGTTLVSAGKLLVNGSLSSSGVTVANGAVFGGNASISSLTLQSGASLSPGNSIGTINISGNLTLNSGSTTIIEIQQAQSDRIVVGGTAAVAGTLQLVALGGPYSFGTPYTFLTATGGLTGTFGTVSTNGTFGLGVTSNVTYNGTSASVTLSAGSLSQVASNLSANTPSNVLAVATAIDRAVANGANSSAFFQVYNQPTQETLRNAVNSLSGEVHATASAMSFKVSDQFLRIMLSPPGTSQKIKVETDEGTAFWSAGFGQAGRTDGDAATGSSRQSHSDWNIAFGMDAPVYDDTIVGFAVSAGSSQSSLASNLGSADADVLQVGVYGTTKFDRLSLGLAGSWSNLNVDTSRAVPTLGSGMVEADYRTNTWSGRAEAAYAAVALTESFTVSPFAALQAHLAHTPDFVESVNGGSAAHALSVNDNDNRFVRSEVGARIDLTSIGADGAGVVYATAAWAHYFVNDASVSAALVGLSGSNFTVEGAQYSQNSALLGLGANIALTPSMTFAAELNAEIGARQAMYGGNAKLRVSF